MKRLACAIGATASSGRFISVWSIAVTLPLSFTLMAPDAVGARWLLITAGALTWAAFALALLIVGAVERRVASAGARAWVIAVGIAFAAGSRPVVQDAILRALGTEPPPVWQLGFRIATNLFVWAVVLTTVAVLTVTYTSLRETNRLLAVAIAQLNAAEEAAASFDRRARDAVRDSALALAEAIDEAELASVDPARRARAVHELGTDRIRQFSHELSRLAESHHDHIARGPSPTDAAPHPRGSRPVLAFRLPPKGVIAIIYFVCALPYAVRSTSLQDVVIGSALIFFGGALVDEVPRRLHARGVRRVTAYAVLIAAAVGVVLAAQAALSGVEPALVIVPAIAFPTLAAAAVLCSGSLHAERVERRRLSAIITNEQRASLAGTRVSRSALRAAAETLHRDAQGRCALLLIEHPRPTADEIAVLLAELRALVPVVAHVFDHAQTRPEVSLDALVQTWGRVIALEARVDPAAREVLQADALLTQEAYDVVAEGLLNAVKHTADRRATVSIDVLATAAGPHLRVRVQTFGALPRGTSLRTTSQAHLLGARLHPTPDGARLEALFRLNPNEAAVVSPEHHPSPTPPRS